MEPQGTQKQRRLWQCCILYLFYEGRSPGGSGNFSVFF